MPKFESSRLNDVVVIAKTYTHTNTHILPNKCQVFGNLFTFKWQFSGESVFKSNGQYFSDILLMARIGMIIGFLFIACSLKITYVLIVITNQ